MLVRRCKLEIEKVGMDGVGILGMMVVLLRASLGCSESMIGISWMG